MVARNLLIPFRRDRKRDLATGDAEALLASKVRQVLLTEGATAQSTGELPWRTSFGAGLSMLRHQRNEAVLGELAKVCVRDALTQWVPAARLLGVELQRSGPSLILRVRVREQHLSAEVSVPFR